MITNNDIKRIMSYKQKKYRLSDNVFVIEGRKMLQEALNSNYRIDQILATNTWLNQNDILEKHHEKISLDHTDITALTEQQLKKISSLDSPDSLLCIMENKKHIPIQTINELVLALDNINNPGNLGTIIRLACWFGIKNIVCNQFTADYTNSKVLQSSMGAIFHVNISYCNLYTFLSKHKEHEIYGTILQGGKNIYKEHLSQKGIIIIGNESHGIAQVNRQFVNNPITIPSFATNNCVESLNAAIACGIILSEFKRQSL